MIERAKEKLKSEFENQPNYIQEIINNLLIDEVDNEEFAEKFLSENKSLAGMWHFIQDCARQKLGNGGYLSPAIVYSLALHYYQEDKPIYVEAMMKEDNLEFGIKNTEYTVNKTRIIHEVVNRAIDLSPEEIEKLKQTTADAIKLKKKKVVENPKEVIDELTLF